MVKAPGKPLAMQFGRVLKAHRMDSGLSQEELAHRAAIDRTFVSMLERGLRLPTLGVILALAHALNTSGAQLIAQVEQLGMSPHTDPPVPVRKEQAKKKASPKRLAFASDPCGAG
ncbi:MAG: helix-turn-helix transcriptional regulator [Corticimicrobacter sp.]